MGWVAAASAAVKAAGAKAAAGVAAKAGAAKAGATAAGTAATKAGAAKAAAGGAAQAGASGMKILSPGAAKAGAKLSFDPVSAGVTKFANKVVGKIGGDKALDPSEIGDMAESPQIAKSAAINNINSANVTREKLNLLNSFRDQAQKVGVNVADHIKNRNVSFTEDGEIDWLSTAGKQYSNMRQRSRNLLANQVKFEAEEPVVEEVRARKHSGGTRYNVK